MNWILEILKKHTDENGVIDMEKAMAEINKDAPKNVMPKDVYNTVAKEKKAAEDKVKAYEDAKLTDDERQQKLIDDANAEKEKYQMIANKSEVEKILLAAGMAEDDYKGFIDGIVTADAEASKNTATAMANTFKTKAAAIEEQAKNDVLKGTPRPGSGDGDDTENKKSAAEEFAKAAATLGTASAEVAKSAADYYLK